VILVSRNEPKGNALAGKLCALHGDGAAAFVRADMANLTEVRVAAQQVQEQHSRIDVLINNAGARFNEFKANAAGVELTFATNHLGHFLLTHLLRERLDASAGARIIVVASDAHSGYSAEFEYVTARGAYDRKAAYGRSKLANILFTYELARRLASTSATANALHPGGVATALGRNNGVMSWVKHIAYYAMKRQLISPARAAEAITHLALSDEVQGVTGKYFSGRKPIRSSPASYDANAARKLWNLSLELCGMARSA
jgi:NAD(P)-dependent dehydrogenase (short-subunit alcohol dehydrogenase family)